MNLDKIIELIAEQIAREVLDEAEDHQDREDEENPTIVQTIQRIDGALNLGASAWLTEACRVAPCKNQIACQIHAMLSFGLLVPASMQKTLPQ